MRNKISRFYFNVHIRPVDVLGKPLQGSFSADFVVEKSAFDEAFTPIIEQWKSVVQKEIKSMCLDDESKALVIFYTEE